MKDIKLSDKKSNSSVTLSEWVSDHYTDEERREVFLNMDIALKYIHDHGYCIEIFHPSKIEILNNNPEYVRFNNIIMMDNLSTSRDELIKEDIFNSTLIQIGIYTNTFKSLTPNFLRENFDEIARFIPEGDVPYYRGIVQRGASVYLSEFAIEKMNRDLVQLEQQINESEGNKPTQGMNLDNKHIDNLSNDRINDHIYRQISGVKEAAFITNVLVPTLIVLSIILMFLIVFIIMYKK